MPMNGSTLDNSPASSFSAPVLPAAPAPRPSLAGGSARPYILLSIGAAVLTISLKMAAFLLTDSVGLFSDAAESLINLVAAVAAFAAVTVAERPADAEHRLCPSGAAGRSRVLDRSGTGSKRNRRRGFL